MELIRKQEEIQQRLKQLEERLAWCEQRLAACQQENEKLKKDMRFFEAMLLEEYHLLLELLEKNKTEIRLHHL